VAEFDLVIRGGTIVDGTGIPRYRADLAVKNGRVAKISGRINAEGAREIDARDCIVAPGAIDLHTHYDAQIQWDPYASLSGWFGVTSLTIGECGFGFAPTKAEDRDLNMRMMDRIEAIPLASMRKGMRWDWETFPQYLDSLERQGLGLNVGALVPFSPLRGYVLGMIPARERTSVTGAELEQMKQIFHEAMKAGAFGLSFSNNMEDRPEDGSFLPSHVASDEEFLGLSEILGEFGVGHMGLTLGLGLTLEERQKIRNRVAETMRISGRPLHLLDVQRGEDPAWEQMVREEGLPLMYQRGSVVNSSEFKLSEYNLYDYMPNWVEPLLGSPEERAAKLRDSGVREAMKNDVEEWPNIMNDWSRVSVLEVVHERNQKFEGATINELAEMTGKEPLDALLDLALDEGLGTEFLVPPLDSPDELEDRRRDLLDPHTHISMSDGGAHTKFLTISTWPVEWLSFWVRDREIMTLEQAHYKMSALPAWFTDFKDRGTLRVGSWADIIVYNLDELGYLYDRPIFANDFPGGESRMVQKPTGLRYTVVNGTVTFEGNDCTGALPGKLLRSYDMVG
jgi:N-acyl-D-aspartate/D-glutamate deacylase